MPANKHYTVRRVEADGRSIAVNGPEVAVDFGEAIRKMLRPMK